MTTAKLKFLEVLLVPYEASTLLSCEQVTKHGLVIIPEQKQTPKNAIVYGSSVDIK